MDRTRTMPRIALILIVTLTALGMTLRSVCMLERFDQTVGYFTDGPLTTLSNALYGVALLVAILCGCMIPKGTLPHKLGTRLRLPAACLYGLLLLVFAVGTLVILLGEQPHKILLLPCLLGLFSAPYFLLSGERADPYPDWLSLLGFLPVFWCVASIWETYVDPFTALNSPIKIGLQLGFLGLSFLQVSELRFRLGKPLPRCAVTLMGMGVFLALNGSIPVLLGSISHILQNKLHLFYALVLLCGGLYGLYVLFQYTWFPADPEESPKKDPSSDLPYDPLPADDPVDPNAE